MTLVAPAETPRWSGSMGQPVRCSPRKLAAAARNSGAPRAWVYPGTHSEMGCCAVMSSICPLSSGHPSRFSATFNAREPVGLCTG